MQLSDKESVRAFLRRRHETVIRELANLQGRVQELVALMAELEQPVTIQGQSVPDALSLLREAGKDGVSISELAALMNTPKSTAASRLQRLKVLGHARHAKRRYFIVRSAPQLAQGEARV